MRVSTCGCVVSVAGPNRPTRAPSSPSNRGRVIVFDLELAERRPSRVQRSSNNRVVLWFACVHRDPGSFERPSINPRLGARHQRWVIPPRVLAVWSAASRSWRTRRGRLRPRRPLAAASRNGFVVTNAGPSCPVGAQLVEDQRRSCRASDPPPTRVVSHERTSSMESLPLEGVPLEPAQRGGCVLLEHRP